MLAAVSGRRVLDWVLPMALAHRGRRSPLEDHGLDRPALEEALRDLEEAHEEQESEE